MSPGLEKNRYFDYLVAMGRIEEQKGNVKEVF